MNFTFQTLLEKRVCFNQLTLRAISEINQFDMVYEPLIEEFKSKILYTRAGELTINLDSLNLSKTRALFSLFQFMEEQEKQGAKLKITWQVPTTNLMMLETALDFAEMYELQVCIAID